MASDLIWGGAVCGPQVSGWDAWLGTQKKEQVGKEVGRGWVVSVACVRGGETSGGWVLWMFYV